MYHIKMIEINTISHSKSNLIYLVLVTYFAINIYYYHEEIMDSNENYIDDSIIIMNKKVSRIFYYNI